MREGSHASAHHVCLGLALQCPPVTNEETEAQPVSGGARTSLTTEPRLCFAAPSTCPSEG